jgi:hypothetical protein
MNKTACTPEEFMICTAARLIPDKKLALSDMGYHKSLSYWPRSSMPRMHVRSMSMGQLALRLSLLSGGVCFLIPGIIIGQSLGPI